MCLLEHIFEISLDGSTVCVPETHDYWAIFFIYLPFLLFFKWWNNSFSWTVHYNLAWLKYVAIRWVRHSSSRELYGHLFQSWLLLTGFSVLGSREMLKQALGFWNLVKFMNLLRQLAAEFMIQVGCLSLSMWEGLESISDVDKLNSGFHPVKVGELYSTYIFIYSVWLMLRNP